MLGYAFSVPSHRLGDCVACVLKRKQHSCILLAYAPSKPMENQQQQQYGVLHLIPASLVSMRVSRIRTHAAESAPTSTGRAFGG